MLKTDVTHPSLKRSFWGEAVAKTNASDGEGGLTIFHPVDYRSEGVCNLAISLSPPPFVGVNYEGKKGLLKLRR